MSLFKKAAMVAAVSICMSCGAAQAAVPESTDTINVIMNDWTGQHVSTKIAGELLKKMGYNIEYVSAGALPQHAGLAQGNLHFQAEVWTNNIGDLYPKAVAAGDIVVLGELGLEPREGWVYPPYMEERCPGLPGYQALYDCAQAFAAADTFPKGRLITYPADWGTRSRDIISSIEMPYEPVAGGSEGAMMAELKSAYAAKDPIIMMMWQPHWVFADLDLNWVEWNPTEVKCVEENQQRDTACGFEQAKVVKVAWKGFEEKWPAAYKMLSLYSQTNDEQNAAILEVDNKGRDLDDVVAEWLANNESKWQGWIEEAMK